MMRTDASAIDTVAAGEIEHSDTVANQAFGFWLYVMSDLVLFATIFATYVVLSHNYAGGPSGKDLFHIPYTFGETMLLLCSSATYGLGVLAMHKNKKDAVLAWLIVTFMFGLGFIAMEINEFHHMILDGHGPERSGFLSAFFTLVGTHGTHVTFGLIWMAAMMGQVYIKGLTAPVQSRLMRLSMFWHFLDIVWVGVFTIVYLIGVM
jgi:cytochrome o ubiquinol oxidase subunit 3